MLAEVKAGGAAAADRYKAWLWDSDRSAGRLESGVVGHLNGAHWRAWTADGADAAHQNSRLSHWKEQMSTMQSAATDGRQGGQGGQGEQEQREASEAAEAAEAGEAGGHGEAGEEGEEVEEGEAGEAPGDARACSPPTPRSPPALPPTTGLLPIVSVILPIHNGESWLDGCLEALLAQTHLVQTEAGPAPAGLPCMELSAFDDGSSDCTWERLETHWRPRLQERGWRVTTGRGGAPPGGCGLAKNRAVAASCGEWLCFQDVCRGLRRGSFNFRRGGISQSARWN